MHAHKATTFVLTVLLSLAVGGLAACAKAPAKEDLLQSVSLQHSLEAAIESKDHEAMLVAVEDLQLLWHQYRKAVPAWMKDLAVGDARFGVRDTGHELSRIAETYTLADLDSITEVVATNLLLPVYPVVGHMELVYHHLYRLQVSAGKKFAGGARIVKDINAQVVGLEKAGPANLKADIAALKSGVVALVKDVEGKQSAPVRKQIASLQAALLAMEQKVGVPKP